MNGNGGLDLAVGNENGPNRVYLDQLDQGELLETTASWMDDDGDSTSSVAWGDMDRDGDLDLAVSHPGGQDLVYVNDGSAGFGSTTNFGTGTDQTRGIALADMDRDGDLDIVAALHSEETLGWWENVSGDGSVWVEHAATTTLSGPLAVHAADLVGAGDRTRKVLHSGLLWSCLQPSKP